MAKMYRFISSHRSGFHDRIPSLSHPQKTNHYFIAMTISHQNSTTGGPQFVGIKFCPECNNMLYPKEDKQEKRSVISSRN